MSQNDIVNIGSIFRTRTLNTRGSRSTISIYPLIVCIFKNWEFWNWIFTT